MADTTSPSPPLLRTANLTKAFRGLVALRNQAITIEAGEIVGVIGPNGSGKSTFFNLVTGFSRPNDGVIEFQGESIAGLSTAKIVARGIARTFQGSRLFTSLSVRDNVRAAAQLRHPIGPLAAVARGPKFRRHMAAANDEADELLSLMGLENLAQQPAAALPYGDQRRLEIARALATKPQLLLLDEPAAGLDFERNTRARGTHPHDPRPLRHRGRGCRARHGPDHEPVRAHPGSRDRRSHLHRHAAGGP
ncbi:Vitamin B12 import ATP-binding protein BtuD [Labrys miyagiensis]